MLMPMGDCLLPEFSLENRKKKGKKGTRGRETRIPSERDGRKHPKPRIRPTILNLCQ
uniref:Alternative protein AJAP1 n=1 Tax=Homo sapiens TaxID=9606 RepID=L8E8W6_HUMAN|nr:alternative protein AJAP1 [Homo sapiens]